jgi:hypothetical protein
MTPSVGDLAMLVPDLDLGARHLLWALCLLSDSAGEVSTKPKTVRELTRRGKHCVPRNLPGLLASGYVRDNDPDGDPGVLKLSIFVDKIRSAVASNPVLQVSKMETHKAVASLQNGDSSRPSKSPKRGLSGKKSASLQKGDLRGQKPSSGAVKLKDKKNNKLKETRGLETSSVVRGESERGTPNAQVPATADSAKGIVSSLYVLDSSLVDSKVSTPTIVEPNIGDLATEFIVLAPRKSSNTAHVREQFKTSACDLAANRPAEFPDAGAAARWLVGRMDKYRMATAAWSESAAWAITASLGWLQNAKYNERDGDVAAAPCGWLRRAAEAIFRRDQWRKCGKRTKAGCLPKQQQRGHTSSSWGIRRA